MMWMKVRIRVRLNRRDFDNINSCVLKFTASTGNLYLT